MDAKRQRLEAKTKIPSRPGSTTQGFSLAIGFGVSAGPRHPKDLKGFYSHIVVTCCLPLYIGDLLDGRGEQVSSLNKNKEEFLVQRKDNSITPLLKWTSCRLFGVFSLLEGKNVYLFKISHSISCLGMKQNALQLRSPEPELEPGRVFHRYPFNRWMLKYMPMLLACCGTTNVSLVHDFFSPKKSS